MSTNHMRLLCVLLPLLLGSCGFQPVYGKHKASRIDNSQIYAGVQVDPVPGRNGQLLHSQLEDALNPEGRIPNNPAYRLVASLSINEVAIGVARDATVSRYNLYFDSSYTLYRNSDGKAITQGIIHQVGSYNNAANAYFSTYISRDDGIRRGITELSELYRMRLGAYLSAGAVEENSKPEPAKAKTFYPNTNWRNEMNGALGTSVNPATNLSQ